MLGYVHQLLHSPDAMALRPFGGAPACRQCCLQAECLHGRRPPVQPLHLLTQCTHFTPLRGAPWLELPCRAPDACPVHLTQSHTLWLGPSPVSVVVACSEPPSPRTHPPEPIGNSLERAPTHPLQLAQPQSAQLGQPATRPVTLAEHHPTAASLHRHFAQQAGHLHHTTLSSGHMRGRLPCS